MAFRTHCDWCGEVLDADDDRAVMPVTIHHPRGRTTLDARWAEETKPTRHFCAAPREDTDRGGRNRAGLVPDGEFDNCYDRALAVITGRRLGDPGAGMEWRLMPVPGGDLAKRDDPHREGGPAEVVDAPAVATDIPGLLRNLCPSHGSRLRRALHRAGIVSLDQIAAMSDDQLLVIDGIGHGSLKLFREAIRARGYDGATLLREVYDLIREGLARIGDGDPSHAALAGMLPGLAGALGMSEAIGTRLLHQGEGLGEGESVSEAWRHVRDGYARALEVRGLPTVEVDSLRAMLLAAQEIIGESAAAS